MLCTSAARVEASLRIRMRACSDRSSRYAMVAASNSRARMCCRSILAACTARRLARARCATGCCCPNRNSGTATVNPTVDGAAPGPPTAGEYSTYGETATPHGVPCTSDARYVRLQGSEPADGERPRTASASSRMVGSRNSSDCTSCARAWKTAALAASTFALRAATSANTS